MKTKKEQAERLQSTLPNGATLLFFDYNERCFGNIITEIQWKGRKHTFHTDRGEIWHNGKLLRNTETDSQDTFLLLLQTIQETL